MSKPSFLLLDLYCAGAEILLKMRLGGARQREAVLALRTSGKSLTTEVWIVLASWHVKLRKFSQYDEKCFADHVLVLVLDLDISLSLGLGLG